MKFTINGINCVQGEMIDSIAKNMMSAVDYVEQAKTETTKAVVFQKKARRVRRKKTS